MARIYVFDGEPEQQEVIAAFAGTPVQVTGSDDFDLALEALHVERFDLVVVGQGGAILGLALLDRIANARARAPSMLIAPQLTQAEMATACKLGVAALLVRPVGPDEIRARAVRLLGIDLEVTPAAPPASVAPARPGRDLLVADCDDDGASLEVLVPAGLSVDRAGTPEEVLERCRSTEYRMVVIDSTHLRLLDPVRTLQPTARLAVVYLRTRADRTEEAHRAGFHTFLTRPYDRAELDEVLYQQLEWRDLLATEGNVLRPAAFPGKSRHLDDYYRRLLDAAPAAVDALASACCDDMVLDLTFLPPHISHTAELIVEVANHAHRLGMTLRVVAPHDLAAMVRGLPGEHAFQAFDSIDDALAAA